MNDTIVEAEPTRGEGDLPLPPGARRNEALGGATSIAPGRNYVQAVYDVDARVDAVTRFYELHLPDAKRTTDGEALEFSTPAGRVRLQPSASGTRITLTVGPQ